MRICAITRKEMPSTLNTLHSDFSHEHLCEELCNNQTERQTGRETDRQTEMRRERWGERDEGIEMRGALLMACAKWCWEEEGDADSWTVCVFQVTSGVAVLGRARVRRRTTLTGAPWWRTRRPPPGPWSNTASSTQKWVSNSYYLYRVNTRNKQDWGALTGPLAWLGWFFFELNWIEFYCHQVIQRR